MAPIVTVQGRKATVELFATTTDAQYDEALAYLPDRAELAGIDYSNGERMTFNW